jgi:hypothetical protein
MFLLMSLYDIKAVEMGNFIATVKKYVEIFPRIGASRIPNQKLLLSYLPL